MFFNIYYLWDSHDESLFFYYIVQNSSPGVKPEAKMIFVAVPPKWYLVLIFGIICY